MLNTLRQRNFALLWSAGLISMIGDWVLFISLPIYVYTLTQSTLATGIMFMVGTLPRILLGSVAGVFADRWDRKNMMVAADLSCAVLLLLLLFARDAQSIWIVYIVAFLQSIISQFFGPAEDALLPQLVDASLLVPANSLNALNNNLARLAGPALGGVLLASFGFRTVVIVDAISFLLSGLMIAAIVRPSSALVKTDGTTHAPPTRMWQDWLSGLRFIWGNYVVLVIFLMMAIGSIAEGLFNVMFVVFIRESLAGGAQEFGWLTSAQAIGGLLGSLMIGWMGHRIRPNRLLGLLAVNGLLILTFVNLPSLPVALTALLLAGIPIVGYSVGRGTLLQLHVEDRFRGRVFGALGTSMAIFVLVGQAIASALGDTLGDTLLLSAKGLLDILAGILAFVLLYNVRSGQSEISQDGSTVA